MSEQEKNEFVEDEFVEEDGLVEDDSVEQDDVEYAEVTIDALEDDAEFIVDAVNPVTDDAEDVEPDALEDSPEDDLEQEPEDATDLDAEADAMLRDIEAEGPFALRSHPDAEELDPAEITPDVHGGVDSVIDDSAEDIADESDVDELPESLEIQESPQDVFVDEYDDEYEDEKSERSRKRLRNILIFFIIVLLVVAAVIGVFIWKNSMSPDVKQSDPDALQTPSAGTRVTHFLPVNPEVVPDFVSYFGMTPEEAADASGNSIALDEMTTPTEAGLAAANTTQNQQNQQNQQSQEAQPAEGVVYATRNGYLVANGGEIVANITFGLDKDGHIIEISTAFDLDSYGVADAKFDELISDETVAASMLSGAGVETPAVDEAHLCIKENADAVTSRDTAGREQAEFSGSTNRETAPTTWKITEIYDHAAGTTTGDNSVIRTLILELR